MQGSFGGGNSTTPGGIGDYTGPSIWKLIRIYFRRWILRRHPEQFTKWVIKMNLTDINPDLRVKAFQDLREKERAIRLEKLETSLEEARASGSKEELAKLEKHKQVEIAAVESEKLLAENEANFSGGDSGPREYNVHAEEIGYNEFDHDKGCAKFRRLKFTGRFWIGPEAPPAESEIPQGLEGRSISRKEYKDLVKRYKRFWGHKPF